MPEDMNKRIMQYVQIRDKLKEIDEAHETARKPLVELQAALSGRLQKFLDDNNMESLKTEHGTCYKSTRYTTSLADPDAFMRFVISNNQFDLLDRRANSTAVKEYVNEHNNLPPGCNLNGITTVGVRRPTGK
jgi:hypothetical protein